jgi:hypothetical protein
MYADITIKGKGQLVKQQGLARSFIVVGRSSFIYHKEKFLYYS